MSLQDTWRADTIRIIGSGGVSVTIQSASWNFGVSPPASATASTVGTATVQIFEMEGSGRLVKDSDPRVAEGTHVIFAVWTGTISVGHRLRESGASTYYEVVAVHTYEDHKEIIAKIVEGR